MQHTERAYLWTAYPFIKFEVPPSSHHHHWLISLFLFVWQGGHIRFARCSDLLSVCSAISLRHAMSSACQEWPCAFCALKVPHTATLRGGVYFALKLAQSSFRDQRINEFQVEMAEAAAMHLMSQSDDFSGFSAQEIRDMVLRTRQAPFNIFARRSAAITADTTTTANVAICPPAPPPPPPVQNVYVHRPSSASSSGVSRASVKRARDEEPRSVGAACSTSDVALSEYKWQVMIGKGRKTRWSDACAELDRTLEEAFIAGRDSTTWRWDGWLYYYEFGSTMIQTSPSESGTERPIRRIRRDATS